MLFKNREMFPLNRNEKILREVLRIILFVIFSAIIKGCFNQSNNIDEDNILVPIVSTASELFCMFYIANAFTSGNLVRRWANDSVFASVFNFIQTKKNTTDEKALKLTTKAFGIFAMFLLGITILWELDFYFWTKAV